MAWTIETLHKEILKPYDEGFTDKSGFIDFLTDAVREWNPELNTINYIDAWGITASYYINDKVETVKLVSDTGVYLDDLKRPLLKELAKKYPVFYWAMYFAQLSKANVRGIVKAQLPFNGADFKDMPYLKLAINSSPPKLKTYFSEWILVHYQLINPKQ